MRACSNCDVGRYSHHVTLELEEKRPIPSKKEARNKFYVFMYTLS